ncbi:hypothetical protein LEN26_017547, partial [Aphanomyces euteiches]
MGDADKAQYSGFVRELERHIPGIDYLMCFFHVLKNCYDRKNGMTSAEWRDVSFDIYHLHLSRSVEKLHQRMREVYDKWDVSRPVSKFRSYFFKTWLPQDNAFTDIQGHRFWKWQIFHTQRGCSYTNNPNEHFNRLLKDVIGRVKKHIPHLIQEFVNHIHDLSEESRPRLDTPVVSERMMKYFKQLCKEELLSFHAVPGARSWHVRQMELRQDAQVHGLDIIQDQQDIACVKYSAISRNIQRLGYVNQPDR